MRHGGWSWSAHRALLAAWVLVSLLGVLSAAHAGRNANGALIVHTNDAVSYTYSGDYCGIDYDAPDSCEAAGTRTDKDENTPAVIWLLAAFSDSSSPAVTAIQFGIEHNLPSEQGYFENYEMCGSVELPDAGWPETGVGNLVSFGSTVKTDRLFPFYFFAVYGFENAYFGTTVYPSTEEAKFVDDSNPPAEDRITRFGTARWYAQGSNDCPGGDGDENPEDPGGDQGDEPQNDGSFSSSYVTPSNDQEPFHRIHIYDDLVDGSCYYPHWLEYLPDSLQEDTLLVVRDYQDTVAVFHSFVTDHITLVHFDDLTCNEPGRYCTFNLSQPRRATSVFLMTMARSVLADDGGLHLASLSIDDDTSTVFTEEFIVGEQIRTGSTIPDEICGAYYSDPPSDSLCGEVWHGPSGQWSLDMLDVQERALPKSIWNRPLRTITLSTERYESCPEVQSFASLDINGISLGTNFEIRTDEGDTVSTQKQYDPAWAATPYGGRIVSGDLVGAWRTIQALGCYLTCFSMMSEFYGTDCRPDELNAFARSNGCYDPLTRARVDWITGEDVGDTVNLVVTPEGRGSFREGDRLLLEHEDQPETPVGVVAMIPPYSGQSRRGIIERRFSLQDSLIVQGDLLRSYSLLNPFRLNRYGGTVRYTIRVVRPSTEGCVDLIEGAMLAEQPVVIQTKFVGGTPQHWVVADGMRPHWDASGQEHHRGTYPIHDPGANRDELLDDPYLNKIARAVITEPVDLLDQDDEGTLVLTLTGSAVLEVTDPIGGRLLWNAEAGGYEVRIAGCSILPGYSIGEPGDSIPDFLLDYVEIQGPATGNYLLEVSGTGGDGFALSIGAHDAPGGGYRSAFRAGETETGVSSYFRLSYSSDPDSSLIVEELDPAQVSESGSDQHPLTCSIRPNPAFSDTDVVFRLQAASHVRIGVFDVTGRRVASLADATFPPGLQRVRWDGRAEDGRFVVGGIYFVRMDVGGRHMAEKVVWVR